MLRPTCAPISTARILGAWPSGIDVFILSLSQNVEVNLVAQRGCHNHIPSFHNHIQSFEEWPSTGKLSTWRRIDLLFGRGGLYTQQLL